jgi:hypothetical protein
MKKLFAVATLVASSTAAAVIPTPPKSEVSTSTAPEPVAPNPVAAKPVALEPVVQQPAIPPVAIKPLALLNGWPACGNVVNKAGYGTRRPCPTTAEQTVHVVVDSVLTGGKRL